MRLKLFVTVKSVTEETENYNLRDSSDTLT